MENYGKLTPEQLKIQKKWKNSNIKISKEIRDIIHGYVMADGYLTKNGSLQIDQSRDQANFVNWLYEKLEPIRTNAPIQEIIRTDLRTNTKTFSKRFYTKSLLKGFRHMWYKSHLNRDGVVKVVKVLPKSLDGFFTDTMLTLWFAGDGTKTIGHRGSKIEATSFSLEERQRLQKLFQTKFGIQVNLSRQGVSKTGTVQWAICINSVEYDKFRNLITKLDLIPRFFPHKLHKKSIL